MTAICFDSHATIMTPLSSLGSLTRGVSEQHSSIRKAEVVAFNHFSKRVSNNVEASLERIGELCSIPNWDGYDAVPISEGVIENVRSVLVGVLQRFPMPELTPESDGEIAIEWYGSAKGVVFSISVGESATVNYSGRFADGGKVYGADVITQDVRVIFETYISRVLGKRP